MKKLSVLDKAIAQFNDRFHAFSDWRRYETHRMNEYVGETAPIYRLWLTDKVTERTPYTDHFLGHGGKQIRKVAYFLTFENRDVVRVFPEKYEYSSHYAYDTGYVNPGITIKDFMVRNNIGMADVKFIIEVRSDYNSFGPVTMERSVTIYGRRFTTQTVCESLKAKFEGTVDPWILHAHTQPETVYGHANMTFEDYEKLYALREEKRDELTRKQELVQSVIINVLGIEAENRINNFINFGEE